jgi:serine/threonine-protein kinase
MNDSIAEALAAGIADRYRVERPLGAGGMAVVYQATDLRHERAVAIKVLRPDLATSIGPERFLREIRIAARLQHPHILGLIDSGEIPTTPGQPPLLYYVMPLVEGESLRDRLDRDRSLPIPQSIRLLREIADALAKAHRSGIVHRDIKPDNVLLADGHAFVADFGVARAVRDATATGTQTALGVAVGTPAYMAPEQVAADPNVDHRADIYALGVVGYEMLAGRLPFLADAPHQLLAAHITTPPEPLAPLRPDAPKILVDAVMRCLAKNPSERFQTADELLARLELLTTGTGETGALRQDYPRRRAVAVGMIAAVMAALSGALYLALSRGNGAAPRDGDFASLAVLPLVNLSRDSSSEYFSDGITEEILSTVSRIPGVRVAARTSAFAFKGKAVPAPELAKQLHVRHLLEGSVERSGDAVRVRARLVDGPRDTEIWNQRFDHSASDLFALQDSVAGAVARALTSTIGAGQAIPGAGRTTDPDAYDDYLRGIRALRARTGPAELEEAVRWFDRAVARDSGFARAWAGLASAWTLMPDYGARPAAVAIPEARRAIARALALDSANGEVLAAQGYLLRSYDHDWRGAEQAFREALALDPNAATTWQWLGETLDGIGRYPGADSAFARALTLDPMSPVVMLARGSHFLAAGDIARGREELARAMALQPGFWPASVQVWLLDVAEGKLEQARKLVASDGAFFPFGTDIAMEILAAKETGTSSPGLAASLAALQGGAKAPVIVVASLYAILGETGEALDALDEGIRRNEPLGTLIRWWPALKPLHGQPRFHQMLQHLKLPPVTP